MRDADAADDHLQDTQAFGVDPVQIFQNERQRGGGGRSHQHRAHRVVGALPPLRRVQLLPHRIRQRQIEQRARGDEHAGLLVAQHAHRGDQLAVDVGQPVLGGDAQQRAHQAGDEEIRRVAVVRHGRRADERAAAIVRVADQLMNQAGLAHPGLAHDLDHRAAPAARPPDALQQQVEFHGAADEAGQAMRRGAGLPPVAADRVEQFEQLDRARDALEAVRAKRARHDEPVGQPRGLGGEKGRARDGRLLDPAGQMRGGSDRLVFHRHVVADGADHHLAGMQADPDFRGALPGHDFQHRPRGEAGPHGVVLMGQRGAEQRHNAVSVHPVHRAAEAMDGLRHGLQGRIETQQRLFRIEAVDDLGRTTNVGEQHGDQLALALAGEPGVQYLRRKFGRHQRHRLARRRRGRFGGGGRRQPHAATGAEPGAAAVALTTALAEAFQRRATRIAETIFGRAVGQATGADHRCGLVGRAAPAPGEGP